MALLRASAHSAAPEAKAALLQQLSNMSEQDSPQKDSGLPLRTANGAMNPDHPMLRRAQQVLARQLNAKRMRVEGELREKQTALQVRLGALQHSLSCICPPAPSSTMQQHKVCTRCQEHLASQQWRSLACSSTAALLLEVPTASDVHLLCLHVLLYLQRAKKQREEVGVELYGFQQNLAKLQMSLERAQGNYQSLSESRVQVGVGPMQRRALFCTGR